MSIFVIHKTKEIPNYVYTCVTLHVLMLDLMFFASTLV